MTIKSQKKYLIRNLFQEFSAEIVLNCFNTLIMFLYFVRIKGVIPGGWALAVRSWILALTDFKDVHRTCDRLFWVSFSNAFEYLVRKALFGLVVAFDCYNA